ncbi:hypothetical protein ACIQZB_02100 [Streptomyces sp. NPDC097727]|uniref:hypothetical protein n=1 Tax=Streptomyces sp. NPDC097727 TaxID=3366092 RepID=UPI00381F6E92
MIGRTGPVRVAQSNPHVSCPGPGAGRSAPASRAQGAVASQGRAMLKMITEQGP